MSGRGCLAGLDAAVLAGGLGTRIASVLGATPKVLAPVNGRPYLDHLLDRLDSLGVGRVVLCLGHLAAPVLAHLAARRPGGPPVEAVVEDEPLGTAGALRLAAPKLASDPVLAMNGDTWVDADLCAFLEVHRARPAPVTVLCVPVDERRAYGRIEVDCEGRVTRYAEKDGASGGPGLVSAGAYLLSQAFLRGLGETPGASLERDHLERMRDLRAHVAAGAAFVDIGTPEGLRMAARVLPGAARSRGRTAAAG